MPSFQCLTHHLIAGVMTALFCSTAALAVTPTQKMDARARFQQDLADCSSPQSSQDPATCRREAYSALAEALRGRLDDNAAPYRENALRRCDVYQGSDRTECVQRLGPNSNVQGSVGGGGILRENITIVPAN